MGDLDTAINEYVLHVKKYNAPHSISECIQFISEEFDFEVETLMAMEHEIERKMEEYYGN